jgi:predicted nucleic acid-binding protein
LALILYLDSSSPIKLYVTEQGSDEVRRLVEEFSMLAASVVAYPEARSALSRLRREGNLTRTGYEVAKAELERDWASYLTLEVTESVWRLAGDLTEKHGLRGLDSIHLATFLLLDARHQEKVQFSSYDGRLRAAARAEAL